MSASFDAIYQSNSAYVDDIFLRYQDNPSSVGLEWQAFFAGFQQGFVSSSALANDIAYYQNILHNLAKPINDENFCQAYDIDLELKIAKFVFAWKQKGHLIAQTNPLQKNDTIIPELEHNFSTEELKKITNAGILIGLEAQPLAKLIDNLHKIFAGTIGIEIEHISCEIERNWLYTQIHQLYAPISPEVQKQIFIELAQTDALEKTIATKYVGKKKFGLEGADAQIPACKSFIDEAVRLGAKECAIAIAHRGRLNLLVNVVGKPLSKLAAEWEGIAHDGLIGDGDVKYHAGYECIQKTRDGSDVNIFMPFNPSHLEAVDCTVIGEIRAKQQLLYQGDNNKIVSLVLHGDAAIAAQGVVYETAQMMKLHAYQIGGTVHIVINNQIGFTTDTKYARSSKYCTDIAKVTNSPVFHINSNDLDALHNLMTLCARYREKFKKDIYIDLVCFRRFGHNEGDEPNFTQPLMYKLIKDQPIAYERYMAYLIEKHNFILGELTDIHPQFRQQMSLVFDRVKDTRAKIENFIQSQEGANFIFATEEQVLEAVDTTFSSDKLNVLAKHLASIPEDFHINNKLARIVLHERLEMAQGQKNIDWGMAELLAYASLISEGVNLRLAGEDCQRGTFAHRHATLIDTEDNHDYTALATINSDIKVEIVNSLLSEYAALGFEYGYSIRNQRGLTLWEAQYGDFANGAQIIIDQYLAACESKWAIQSGLVLLLPHGLEGQGPEHSSARLERYLQLCAQANLQVCNLTNCAQLFHVLRRQVKRNFRKPLIIMTPKSFLRNTRVSRALSDLANGSFNEILDDERIVQKKLVEKVLLCTGKIAFDLLDALEKEENKNIACKIAIIRVEQLYPLHRKKLAQVLKNYPTAKLFWVQHEPKNMGAWLFMHSEFLEFLADRCLNYIGRTKRATPAVGLEQRHIAEQEKLIKLALSASTSCEV